MPDDVLTKLKISFEGLSSSDQRLFLDIGCFYRGKLRSYVEEMLESCDIGSATIRVLIEKSLLSISPYDTIEMHDLIQEMAWHIVREGDTRRREYGFLRISRICLLEIWRQTLWMAYGSQGITYLNRIYHITT